MRAKTKQTGHTIPVLPTAIIMMLVAIIAVVGGIYGRRDAAVPVRSATQAATPIVPVAKSESLVPPLSEPSIMFTGAAEGEIPMVSPERIRASFLSILAYRNHPDLQTTYDREAMEVVERFTSGALEFRLIEKTIEPNGSKPGSMSSMAYLCPQDVFAYRQMRLTDQMLALTVYHELAHKVDCDRWQAGKSFAPECEDESIVGYAAQVRMMSAIMTTSHLPTRVGQEDAGMMGQTMEVWQAFESRQFCTWYKGLLLKGGEVTGPDSAVELIELK